MGAMETKAPMAPNCASSGRKGGREREREGKREEGKEQGRKITEREKKIFQRASRKANKHNLE